MSWFKKLFKRKQDEHKMSSHKVGDITFLTFDHALELPTRRKMAFFNATHEASLRITGPDLEAYLKLVDEAVEEKNLSKVSFLNGMLRQYRDMYSTPRTMFPIGNCVILLPGEPVKDMDKIWTHRKRELFDTNEEVRDFFLTTSIDSIFKLNDTKKDTDVLSYMKSQQVEITEQTFFRLIQRHLQRQSSPSSTKK